jgi:hypothetical protein
MISGCTFAILANVLDFRTYSAPNQPEAKRTTQGQFNSWRNLDRNNIPGDERMAIVHARGIALAVFAWIRKWYIVKDPTGKIIDDLPSKYIVHLLRALLAYKSKAYKEKLKGVPHCHPWMLEAQVSNVVECDSSVEKLWLKGLGNSSHSLLMTLDEGCTVEWRDDIPLGQSRSGELFAFHFFIVKLIIHRQGV